MLILMAGLPGSGKTTLARELAIRTNGRVLGKDEFRHTLFTLEEIEYSSRQDDFCLQLMLETAGYLLGQNPARFIFLDGRTFSQRYQIENVLQAASFLRQPWKILECVCSDDSVRHRLSESTSHPARNRDFQMYLQVKSRFETITHPRIVIDTDEPLANCIEQGLAVLHTVSS